LLRDPTLDRGAVDDESKRAHPTTNLRRPVSGWIASAHTINVH